MASLELEHGSPFAPSCFTVQLQNAGLLHVNSSQTEVKKAPKVTKKIIRKYGPKVNDGELLVIFFH